MEAWRHGGMEENAKVEEEKTHRGGKFGERREGRKGREARE
jgi:hypothetical protein